MRRRNWKKIEEKKKEEEEDVDDVSWYLIRTLERNGVVGERIDVISSMIYLLCEGGKQRRDK